MKTTRSPIPLFYGFAPTPFGECCIAFSGAGIHAMIFAESRREALADLKRRFPKSAFMPDEAEAARLSAAVFERGEMPVLSPFGSPFQLSVWEALQRIPSGETTTYAHIARSIGRPKAVRAVGTAIGANPIAFLIPCHRVLRTDGGLGGFRWGLERKKQMLEWERNA